MSVENTEGILVAASSLGLSIFDLFNEVLTADDMQKFLKQNNVFENHFGAGLIIRTLLLILDFATGEKIQNFYFYSHSESIIKQSVLGKREISHSNPEIQPQNGSPENGHSIENAENSEEKVIAAARVSEDTSEDELDQEKGYKYRPNRVQLLIEVTCLCRSASNCKLNQFLNP